MEQSTDIIEFFIGSYTQNISKGIYKAKFSNTTQKITDLQLIHEIENPSYILKHNDIIFSVSETSTGSIHAFKLDEKQEKLTEISQFKTGQDPCYIEFIPKKNILLISNYSSGNNTIIQVDPENPQNYFKKTQNIQHIRKSPSTHPRQEAAHAHSIYYIEELDIILSADLGCDKLMQYKFTEENSQDILELQAEIDLPEFSGPRHMVYQKEQQLLFVDGELDSTLIVLEYQKDSNTFKFLKSYSTINQNIQENMKENYPSHLLLINNYLYVANRGQDTISVFKIQENKELTLIQNEQYGGKFARHMQATPNNKFILVANQLGNDISILKINEDKTITNTKQSIDISNPAYIQF